MQDRLKQEETPENGGAETALQADAKRRGFTGWMARNPLTTLVLAALPVAVLFLAVSVRYARRQNLVPTDATALMGLAQRYYQEGRYEEAIAITRQLEARQSSYWFSEFTAGNAFYKQGDHARAAEHFEKAAQLNPGEPLPLLNLALMNTRLGNNEKARELYAVVIERFGEDYPHFAERAKTALSLLDGFTPARHPDGF